MTLLSSLRPMIKWICLGFLAGLMSSLHVTAQPMFFEDFQEAAPQGFGNRANTQPWSMIEWRGHLYVGTGRATLCQATAANHFLNPKMPYPPNEPNADCTPLPQDLPLRAEVWRWHPGSEGWTRILQSPEDIEIPGHPGKFVARDVGYRSMLVFQEPDGQEALYVAGVSSRIFNELTPEKYLNNPDLPPPRLLRSTDGITFNPVPQDPGTLLSDIKPLNGFRTLTAFKGRLYIVASVDGWGQGNLLEATDPAKGNDNFRQVKITSKDLKVFETAVFNGSLYVGTGGLINSDNPHFSVLKTNGSGALPYDFKEIIPPGGFSPGLFNTTVISMHVHQGRLFVGTDQELLRINPDDSWDVMVGPPRQTPQGMKHPLSGLGDGFDHVFNIHMWRLASTGGFLYVGTQDYGARLRSIPFLRSLVRERLGFDLYATPNGYHFWLISQTGFGDKFSNGVRNYEVTPFGFFLGSTNHYFGARIWRGFPGNRAIEMPEGLEVDFENENAILSWKGPEEAQTFHIYRDTTFDSFELIGEVDGQTPFFVDPRPPLAVPNVPYPDVSASQLHELQMLLGGQSLEQPNPKETERKIQAFLKRMTRHHYYVVAEDADGHLSPPSNVVRVPVQEGVTVTCKSLRTNLYQWKAPWGWRTQLRGIRSLLGRSAPQYAEARIALAQLRQRVVTEASRLPSPWRSEDLAVLIDKLARRVALAQHGLLSVQGLL